MSKLAVLSALLAFILVVYAKPAIPQDDQFRKNHEDSGVDDVPMELYSLNNPHSEGVFDGDGFSYNGKHLGPQTTSTEHIKQMEDMILIVEEDSDDFEREKRNALRPHPFGATLWPNGLVPYDIESVFTENENRIMFQAMRHWEENTCIRFRKRISNDAYYIVLRTSQPGDCRSFIGRQHRHFQPQTVFLGPNCVQFSTVVHEFGHAIGFYHEHSRVDRDQYVTVIHNNIFPGITGQFGINNGDTLDLGYDYASIMHYSSRAFSRDGQSETLRANSANIPIGRAEELSPLDVLKANRLYQCLCPLAPPTIVVPPPVPPSRPTGVSCGTAETLSSGQSVTRSSPGYPAHRHNQRCAWVFQCPSGYVPQIEFPGLGLELSSGCSKDYAQVYYGEGLESRYIVQYGGLVDGRICDERYSRSQFFVSTDTATVFYRTDSSGSGRTGLQVRVTCIDEDECRAYDNRCHTCTNKAGSFDCGCNPGYYASKAARTCYDINECAYQNGGCEDRCVNLGGSYRCGCTSGFLQADGRSCGPTQPGTVGQPTAPALPTYCKSGDTQVFCPPPPTPINGAMDVTAPTPIGGVVTYLCRSGHILNGVSSRTCQSNGAWSGSQPSCRLAQCPSLTNPTDGSVSHPTRSVGSRATYSCNSGYTLSGSSTRTCQSGGTWSGTAPSCQSLPCPTLLNPANGRVSASSRSVGGRATYFCNPGYTLSGSSTRTCQSGGTWSGSAPTCQTVAVQQCSTLTNPTNGLVITTSTSVGGRATYFCNPGYTLSGSSTRTCQLGGSWSGSAPTCQVATNFYLRSQQYASGSSIRLGDIGEGEGAALIFRTNNPNCCKTQRAGECYYPNGNQVSVRASGDQMYRNRGEQLIRLNRSPSPSGRRATTGLYCCEVPDQNNVQQRVCVNITA